MVGQLVFLDSLKLVLRLLLGNWHHRTKSAFMVVDDLGRCMCMQYRDTALVGHWPLVSWARGPVQPSLDAPLDEVVTQVKSI